MVIGANADTDTNNDTNSSDMNDMKEAIIIMQVGTLSIRPLPQMFVCKRHQAKFRSPPPTPLHGCDSVSKLC